MMKVTTALCGSLQSHCDRLSAEQQSVAQDPPSSWQPQEQASPLKACTELVTLKFCTDTISNNTDTSMKLEIIRENETILPKVISHML